MNPAVVLGLRFGGYGIVRALSSLGIPVIGLERDASCPEAQTGLCEVHSFRSEEDLLSSLLHIGRSHEASPVLFLTNDEGVEFCSEHIAAIREHYLVDLPSPRTIRTLLHKDEFAAFARRHQFRIPNTVAIDRHTHIDDAIRNLAMPCVLKPYKRSVNWRRAGQPKVWRFQSKQALLDSLGRLLAIECRLVLQEWIPGGDDTIYFSLVYFDSNARCLASFTGRKLRQWVPGTGSTSAAEPASEPFVETETLRLFEKTAYCGFGSVEYKKHPDTGVFYIMEPTVGRVNKQSFIATANGVNMPAIAYAELTGRPLPLRSADRSLGRTLYLDEGAEFYNLLSQLRGNRAGLLPMLQSYRAPKAFRYYEPRDRRPFLRFLRRLFTRVPSRVLRKLSGPVRRALRTK